MAVSRRTGRPRLPLDLTPQTRAELESLSRSRTLPAALVRRAKMVLWSAEGLTNTAIAERLETTEPLVWFWRRRFREQGLAGLYGESRPGRPRSYDDDQVAALITKTISSKPSNATQWTMRGLAAETGISKSAVQRYLALFPSSRIAPAASSSRRIPSLWTRSGMSSGSTSTLRTRRLCCVSTRKARSRPSSAPSRSCPWASAMSKVSRTTTTGTAPRRCSPHSMSRKARC